MVTINKNDYPGLAMLKDRKRVQFNEEFKNDVLNHCPYYCTDKNHPIINTYRQNTALLQNINHISEEVIKLSTKNHDSLVEVTKKENLKFKATTFLFKYGVICYILPAKCNCHDNTGDESQVYEVIVCKNTTLTFYGAFIIEKDAEGNNKIGISTAHDEDVDGDNYFFVAKMIDLLVFLKYAKVETIFLNGKAKKNVSTYKNRNIISNNTEFNIKFIDSSWAKEYIRTEGFDVKGFFRLQPYKNGRKELIYIAPFHKNGYHRRARKDLYCDCA